MLHYYRVDYGKNQGLLFVFFHFVILRKKDRPLSGGLNKGLLSLMSWASNNSGSLNTESVHHLMLHTEMESDYRSAGITGRR